MKKGQASIDYLSTYGWALLAMGVALGALYMFMDFKPEQSIPETCSFGDSFNCISFMINLSDNKVNISLSNAVGTEIEINSLICNYDGQEYRTLPSDDEKIVQPGSIFYLSCDMTGAPLRTKSKVDVSVVYYKKGMSFPSTSDGFISGNTVN